MRYLIYTLLNISISPDLHSVSQCIIREPTLLFLRFLLFTIFCFYFSSIWRFYFTVYNLTKSLLIMFPVETVAFAKQFLIQVSNKSISQSMHDVSILFCKCSCTFENESETLFNFNRTFCFFNKGAVFCVFERIFLWYFLLNVCIFYPLVLSREFDLSTLFTT